MVLLIKSYFKKIEEHPPLLADMCAAKMVLHATKRANYRITDIIMTVKSMYILIKNISKENIYFIKMACRLVGFVNKKRRE